MSVMYDLSGRVTIGVSGDERRLHAVAGQLNPFSPREPAVPGAPDLFLEFGSQRPAAAIDIQNPARDGLTTAYDGRALSLRAGDSACTIEPSVDGEQVRLRCDPAFPLGRLFRTIVRPALQAAAVRHDAVAVHSAAVEVDGHAVLVAGWSESGKTETALALMEEGAGWLSDKWTLIGTDGEASAFPINVGVRRWVLPYLPRLAAGLPRSSRVQVAVAGAAATATQPLLRHRSRGGRVGAAAALAERAVGIVDRAALTPDQIRAAYGQDDDAARRVPLGTVALLTTVPGPDISVEKCDPDWAAARLGLTGAYERHDWHMLQDRWRYADPFRPGDDRERAITAERRILEAALSGARLLHVRAPFPVDPRRVAHAIQDAM
jgi:hypothetical protein